MAKNLNINKNTYIFGLLILALIVSIGIGFFVIRPLLQDNKKQQQILDNRKDVVKKLENKKNSLEKISSDIKDLKEKDKFVEGAIPTTQNKKELAYQIFAIANYSGITIDSIDDLKSTVGIEGDSSAIVSATGANDLGFIISIKGSYPGLIAFLDGLKNAARLVSVDNIEIRGEESSLEATISITSYTKEEIKTNEQL
ncbi:type 4a pilus biogenesis protein PilO [bacterium]|nr:type 4a pilus biogenesis protein PilO [bacterium]